MMKTNSNETRMDEFDNLIYCERRNGVERRKKASPGFACITTVGWICRREQARRMDDSPFSCELQAGGDHRKIQSS